MHTHRFIRIDELDTGKHHIREHTASDAARIYSAAELALLARGQTIRRGTTLHCDLNAFLAARRELPDVMTRLPKRRVILAATAGRDLSPAISVATDDDTLTDCVVNLAARRHGLPQIKGA